MKVRTDGPGGQVEAFAYLSIGQTGCRELCDLHVVWTKGSVGWTQPCRHRQAYCPHLFCSAACPGHRAESAEGLVGEAERDPRLEMHVVAAQALAPGEMYPCPLEGPPIRLRQRDRSLEQYCGEEVVFGDDRFRAEHLSLEAGRETGEIGAPQKGGMLSRNEVPT